MAANTNPIFPVAPAIGRATLTAAAAIVSRANIVGTAGLNQLTTAAANGMRVDAINVKGKATTVASILSLWLYDGVTSMLFDEIDIAAVVASNTADSFSAWRTYSNLVLPTGWQLFISETVQTDVTVTAFGGTY